MTAHLPDTRVRILGAVLSSCRVALPMTGILLDGCLCQQLNSRKQWGCEVI